MRTEIFMAVIAMAVLVAGNDAWMTTESYCRTSKTNKTDCEMNGRLLIESGYWGIDAASGCWHRDIPDMGEFCIDNDKKRAHFQLSHQPFRRCLEMGEPVVFRCHRPRPARRRKPRNPQCAVAEWTECSTSPETTLTWREVWGQKTTVGRKRLAVAGPDLNPVENGWEIKQWKTGPQR
ncbi:hypothetical protein XA68_10782 [Ophiocordyceps unilateralis]|uniref:Uncharacterized protein n=1 Tax=Ophiocordyceps unilateralis TaxID=268505 RepID=A0A2A9PGM5_OPHUN|nr:hypothetical protein XA68_10782 [Ophiocordyceps unilateralis]